MAELYLVYNCGCDDTTLGLVELTDEEFSKFKQFVENINRNSTYCCMPRIHASKVSWDMFREKTEDDTAEWKWLYYGDKIFVPNDGVEFDNLEEIV